MLHEALLSKSRLTVAVRSLRLAFLVLESFRDERLDREFLSEPRRPLLLSLPRVPRPPVPGPVRRSPSAVAPC